MKQNINFLGALAVQLGLIWLAPGLGLGTKDRVLMSIIVGVMCIIFFIGTVKISASLDVSQSRFNARYFGSMGLRMIMSLILLGIYLYISDVINKAGTIFLLISYFVYMGFEIQIILHKLRTNSEKSKNTDDARK